MDYTQRRWAHLSIRLIRTTCCYAKQQHSNKQSHPGSPLRIDKTCANRDSACSVSNSRNAELRRWLPSRLEAEQVDGSGQTNANWGSCRCDVFALPVLFFSISRGAMQFTRLTPRIVVSFCICFIELAFLSNRQVAQTSWVLAYKAEKLKKVLNLYRLHGILVTFENLGEMLHSPCSALLWSKPMKK